MVDKIISDSLAKVGWTNCKVYKVIAQPIKKIPIKIIGIFVVAAFFGVYLVNKFIEQGGLSYAQIMQEGRYFAVNEFFNKLNFKTFIFGYPDTVMFEGFSYTYNVIIEIWNQYTIFGLLIFVLVILYRLIYRKKFVIPLFYTFPILIYAFSEAIYLTSWWDFYIYIFLFYRNNDIKF